MLPGTALAGPQNWLNPGGPVAEMQLGLFMLTTWIMVFVFVVVSGLLIYAIVKFRDKGAAQAGRAPPRRRPPRKELPPQFEGDPRLEIVLTIVPFILLIIMAIPTVNLNFALAADPEGDPLHVRVVGHQWWWEFEYMDLGIITGNELRIPTGRPVVLHIETADVIHKFWVPALAGKMDAIPGRVNTKWIQADEPGVYWGQCAEMCGTHHANMRMRVVALPPEEFEQWVANYGRGPGGGDHGAAGRRGAGPAGVRNPRLASLATPSKAPRPQGNVGPNLTDIGGRRTAGRGHDGQHAVKTWPAGFRIRRASSRVPACRRVALSDDELADLVTYLLSLR